MKIFNFRQVLLALLIYGSAMNETHAQEVVAFTDKIVADDRDEFDLFGGDGFTSFNSNVSIFGDYAVVGAPGDSTNDIGAAYLFRRFNSCTWVQVDKILARDTATGLPIAEANARFGTDVKLFGTTIAISAIGSTADGVIEAGAVYIYQIISDVAVIQQLVTAQNESVLGGTPDAETGARFGYSLDMTDNRLIVGADLNSTNEVGAVPLVSPGAAYIYHWDGSNFVFRDKIVASDRTGGDRFGVSVSIFDEFAAVGAPSRLANEGAAYIFNLGPSWLQSQQLVPVDLVPGDLFGTSVTINETDLGVGSVSNQSDASGTLYFPDQFVGAVYMYQLDAGTWANAPGINKIVPNLDVPTAQRFGHDIQLWDNRLIVGASMRSTNECDETDGWAGSAYTYEKNLDDEWDFDFQFSAPDRESTDSYGRSVALHEDNIIVGAPFHSFDEDIDDVTDLALTSAGAAYMFEYKTLPDVPIIESDPIATCSDDPGGVNLTIIGGNLNDGEYWEWYESDCDSDPIGTGTSINVTPEVTTVYCARGKAFCGELEEDYCGMFEGDCGCITVEVNDGFWHQSTDAGTTDHAEDVITDNAGNVYITGEYTFQTTFAAGIYTPELIASGTFNSKSYVAKYDNCGNLLWVAWSDDVDGIDTDWDKGIGITLDESNGLVYVAGNFQDEIHFNGGIGFDAGAPSNATVAGPGEQGYVASFNMNDGAINYIDAVSLNTVTRLSAITVNENNGKIYVGGISSDPTLTFSIFTERYTPSLTTIGTADWLITGPKTDAANYLGDLDYDEDMGDNGSLWMIGGFRGQLLLVPGSGIVTTTTRDAFITRYEDGIIPTQTFLRQGFVNGHMFGEGIAVDEETGSAYFTGYYHGNATNIFGMIGDDLPLTPGSSRQAYFGTIDNTGGIIWPMTNHTDLGTNNRVFGYAVAFQEGKAYYTGTYRADMHCTGGPIRPYFGPLGGLHHLYVVAYDAATGVYEWDNVTTSTSASSRHRPYGITTDDFGHAFIGGGYSYQMGYMLGVPASGDLISTAQEETFTMRVDLVTSELRSSEVLSDDKIEINSEFTFKLMPNPASELTTVQIANYVEGEDYRLKLYGIEGKLILNEPVNSELTEIDLSNLESGVYIVELISHDKYRQLKLIKEK